MCDLGAGVVGYEWFSRSRAEQLVVELLVDSTGVERLEVPRRLAVDVEPSGKSVCVGLKPLS